MGATLNAQLLNTGNKFCYTEAYHVYMESHLRYIRNHPSTQVFPLNVAMVHSDLYNFRGLFLDLGIKFEDHWLTLRLNEYTHDSELDDSVKSLLLPNENLIAGLKRMFQTTQARV